MVLYLIPLLLTATPLGEAPTVPEWPHDLPTAVTLDTGTLLPPALADEITRRLQYLDRYPALCQTAMDAHRDVLLTEKKAELAIQKAKCDSQQIQQTLESNSGWSTLEVVLVAIGGVASGFAAGWLSSR